MYSERVATGRPVFHVASESGGTHRTGVSGSSFSSGGASPLGSSSHGSSSLGASPRSDSVTTSGTLSPDAVDRHRLNAWYSSQGNAYEKLPGGSPTCILPAPDPRVSLALARDTSYPASVRATACHEALQYAVHDEHRSDAYLILSTVLHGSDALEARCMAHTLTTDPLKKAYLDVSIGQTLGRPADLEAARAAVEAHLRSPYATAADHLVGRAIVARAHFASGNATQNGQHYIEAMRTTREPALYTEAATRLGHLAVAQGRSDLARAAFAAASGSAGASPAPPTAAFRRG